MIAFEFSVSINRPVTDVFAYLTDTLTMPEWQSMVLEARQESAGPMRKGATVIETRMFIGRRFESTLLVTTFEPNKRLNLMSVAGPLPFRINNTLAGTRDATTLNVEAQGEPGSFFKLAEVLVGRQAERHLRNDYARLKDILEAKAT